MQSDYASIVKDIIAKNQYLTLATVDAKGNPWASPVAYIYDEDFKFYWASMHSSRHQININHSPRIAFAVFDSTQKWGEGIGIQVEATVNQISLGELPKVTAMYFSRKYPYGEATGPLVLGLKKLLQGSIYHFYKATPTKVWMPDPNAEVDTRIEVDLNTLTK